MSDDEFEEQLRQEQLAKIEEENPETCRTKVDEDGTVYEWDVEKKAWFPKIDSDFIARYQMGYGEDSANANSSQSSGIPDVSDPGYADWYYKHYASSAQKEKKNTGTQSYEELYNYYYNLYDPTAADSDSSESENESVSTTKDSKDNAESLSESKMEGSSGESKTNEATTKSKTNDSTTELKTNESTTKLKTKDSSLGEETENAKSDDTAKSDNIDTENNSSSNSSSNDNKKKKSIKSPEEIEKARQAYAEYYAYQTYYSDYYSDKNNVESNPDSEAYWDQYHSEHYKNTTENVEEQNSKESTDDKNGKQKGIKRPAKDPEWFQLEEKDNTNVYVQGLPTEDFSDTEFQELMNKCGLILYDPRTHKPKLKLYRTADGQLKGDGRCCYIKPESVELALNILDGSEINGKKISVERAKFQLKGKYDPKRKKKNLSKQEKKKFQEKQTKLFDWRPDKPIGTRPRFERILIVKNLFDPKEFDTNPGLINEIRRDLQMECAKSGQCKKVELFDRHPEGVAKVMMSEPEEADVCLQAINNRFFAKRRLQVETWDGRTKYFVQETEEERAKRLKQWEEFLEKGGEEKKSEDKKSDDSKAASEKVSESETVKPCNTETASDATGASGDKME